MADYSDSVRSLEQATPVQRHAVTEFLTRAVATRVVGPGTAVFDVGANAGFHTSALSALVGASGVVHAFEPHPMHWGNLLQFGNVRLWPVAVGDRCSVETFFAPRGNDQTASLHDPRSFLGPDVGMHLLSVPQVTVDSLEEAVRRPITFVKLDVERHEYEALIGMRGVLDRDRPVIVLENATGNIEGFLLALDYRQYRLDHALHRNDPHPNASPLPNSVFLARTRAIDDVAPNADATVAIISDALARG